MGMYDEVTIEFQIPSWQGPKDRWQTKDFECNLDTYEITEDGKLEISKLMFENDEYVNKTSESISGYTGRVDVIHDVPGSNFSSFIEYAFWFKEGQVVRLKRLPEWSNGEDWKDTEEWYYNGAVPEDFSDNLPSTPLTPEQLDAQAKFLAKFETEEGRKEIAELIVAPIRIPKNYAVIGRKLLIAKEEE